MTPNDPSGKVNVGTSENPVWVPVNQVHNTDSTFWRGVVNGGVVVGTEHGGINLNNALDIFKKGQENNNA